MFALPVRSMLYPNEQLPAYTPRWDPETSSVLSSAPSYTSAAPSYHSAVPPFHTGDAESIHGGQQEARNSWYFNHGNAHAYSRSIFNLNADPAQAAQSNSSPADETATPSQTGTAATRAPAPVYAPGFESRALLHGNPSDSQLRTLYGTSSWVPMSSGLQSRAYENVARRRAQQARAEAMLFRSAGSQGGFQPLADVPRLDSHSRRRSTSNLAASAAVSPLLSSREPIVPSIEAARNPVGCALYSMVNGSAVTVAPTPREDPISRVATPAHRESPGELSPAQIPEEEDEPLLPHEDPFLVGEEAAARARNQRLYITSQTQENQLHGILSTVSSLAPDAVPVASKPATPFNADGTRPRRQTDAGTSPSTSRPTYTSLVEQGLQARAQRSRSASTSNVTAMSSRGITRTSRANSVTAQSPPPTTPSTSRSSSSSPSSSSSTLLTPPTPGPRRTRSSTLNSTSGTSSFLFAPAPSVKFASASCTNLLPVTLETEEEQPQQTTTPARPKTGRSPSSTLDDGPLPLSSFLPSPLIPHYGRRSPSVAMTDSPFTSSANLPRLTPSMTAPQAPTQRSGSTDSSGSEFTGRVSPTDEALLIAQESKQWDFMMSQMADWEERQRTWKKFRDDMERKFCSGRRLGLHGIIGWSPFHSHMKSVKKEEKNRGRKRAVSTGAQTSSSWRRRRVGRPA